MSRRLLFLLALCAPVYAASSFAGEISKWVDENGVTHFGNAQFAPAGGGETVAIEPANGMDVPDMAILKKREQSRSVNVRVLQRGKMKNPRGWRGHDGRLIRGGRSTHTRGRRAN